MARTFHGKESTTDSEILAGLFLSSVCATCIPLYMNWGYSYHFTKKFHAEAAGAVGYPIRN
jgi:hypothetical protein